MSEDNANVNEQTQDKETAGTADLTYLKKLLETRKIRTFVFSLIDLNGLITNVACTGNPKLGATDWAFLLKALDYGLYKKFEANSVIFDPGNKETL